MMTLSAYFLKNPLYIPIPVSFLCGCMGRFLVFLADDGEVSPDVNPFTIGRNGLYSIL